MWSEWTRDERLRLMRFVCAFAWADLDVQDEEREFAQKLIRRLRLDPEESAQVQRWLELPPSADEVDPADVPPEHRKDFLEAVQGLSRASGEIDERERESLALLSALLIGEAR